VGTGAPTTNRVKVNGVKENGVKENGVKATIILGYGVNIDLSGTSTYIPEAAPIPEACFDLMVGAEVNLVLAVGTVTVLKSSGPKAGIQAPEGSTLTIRSIGGEGSTDGTLRVYGGATGAGIGGGNGQSGGTITISGGTVSAQGGASGAGIGGGSEADGGKITIDGGTVSATGGDNGSGIGGGSVGNGGTITIGGGTVSAQGGDYGSGIGGGKGP
jgi:hypothetical protein